MSEKYVYLREGKLRIDIGEKTYALETGDSFFFKTDSEHQFHNTGAQSCTYELIILYR